MSTQFNSAFDWGYGEISGNVGNAVTQDTGYDLLTSSIEEFVRGESFRAIMRTRNSDIVRDITPWTEPATLNTWVNYDAVFQGVRYMKDALGFIHLQGLVKDGTVGAGIAIFILPPGHRPLKTLLFPVATNPNTIGRVDITGAGSVEATAGSNTWLSLNGISFKADA